MRKGLILAAAALVAAPLWPADIPDLAGTWVLNVQKSSWGSIPKPVTVVVNVQHNQLSLSYSGSITYSESDSRDFAFAGNIDGTEFPAAIGCGAGKMSFRAVGLDTVVAKFRSGDGTCTESIRMVLSRSGTRLTRYIQAKTSETEMQWVEVYERK